MSQKYRVTAPDGSKFEITAPEGATEQQALEFARQQFQSQQTPQQQRPSSEENNQGQQDRQSVGFIPGFVPPPESRRMERDIERERSFGAAYEPRSLDQRRQDFLKEQQNILKRTKEDIKEERTRKYYASEFFNQFDFGESDIGFYERNRIAAADTFEEKQNQFARFYPDGNLE